MANINIIAPLKAAGNFPVTTADQVQMATNKAVTVDAAITALQEAIGITSGDINPEAPGASETLAAKLDNIDTTLGSLREYITTLTPPVLTVDTNAHNPYDIKETTPPTITITARVSAPLEEPLRIEFDSSDMTKLDDYSYKATWQPQYNNQALPYTVTKTVKIYKNGNSNVVYRSQAVSCTFATKVYYGPFSSESITVNDITSFNQKLSADHPSSIRFEVTGDAKYCYYCCPETYGEPIIRVGGFEGGFDKQKGQIYNDFKINGRPYVVYRSNNELKTTTISLS